MSLLSSTISLTNSSVRKLTISHTSKVSGSSALVGLLTLLANSSGNSALPLTSDNGNSVLEFGVFGNK